MGEKELITKLVTEWHLSVPERKELPKGKAKGSLIIESIEELLKLHGWFPRNWRPNEGFDGGLLELKSNKQCLLYCKNEVGMMRFELKEILIFFSIHEAVKTYAIRFLKNDIDGINIDWDI